MTGSAVEGFTLSRNETWDDLVEDRDLVSISKFDDIGVIRAPYLFHFAMVNHLAHIAPAVPAADEHC
jgi:hypothetical protein